MKLNVTLTPLAACLVAGLTLIPTASAQQPATRHYTTKFEVSITKRANVLLPPYQVLGELAMDVASDGSFSCQITPLIDPNSADAPPSVLLMGGKFVADGPTSLPCSGQISGRLIGITIDMGDDYKIFGTGVLPTDFTKLAPGAITTPFGGTAATSIPGEGGDWFTVCVTVTITNPVTGSVIAQTRVCVSVTATLN